MQCRCCPDAGQLGAGRQPVLQGPGLPGDLCGSTSVWMRKHPRGPGLSLGHEEQRLGCKFLHHYMSMYAAMQCILEFPSACGIMTGTPVRVRCSVYVDTAAHSEGGSTYVLLTAFPNCSRPELPVPVAWPALNTYQPDLPLNQMRVRRRFVASLSAAPSPWNPAWSGWMCMWR